MKMTLREWQQTRKPKDQLIVQASSMNCDDGWMEWPIGMSWQFIYTHAMGDKLQLGAHNNTVLCAIQPKDGTRRPRAPNRNHFLHTLMKNNIMNLQLHHDTYFEELPSFKFVISPEGNGIDCHRHYEALLAGCIPIMEKNLLTEEKYKGCPVVWTTDYSEITNEYLEKLYPKMLDSEYDFSKLLLSSYNSETQKSIKEHGNFWLKRLPTNCEWY